MTPSPLERQELAERLQGFIARSGKTQRQIAEEIGVDESYISKLATGSINWAASRKYFGRLAQALGLRPDEISEVNPAAVVEYRQPTGIRPAHGPEDMQGLTPYRDGVEVRHLGKVAAGRLGSVVYDHIETRRIPDDIANGYNRDDLFTLEVTGDSMTDSDVRFEVKHGETVVIHSSLQPELGDIVSVWLIEEDIGVLKMFKTVDGHTVLESYNKEHRPIVISDETQAIMQGVMIGQWRPRHRRRKQN